MVDLLALLNTIYPMKRVVFNKTTDGKKVEREVGSGVIKGKTVD